MPLEKICTHCGIQKSVADFGNAKHGKDGLRAECRPCVNIRSRKTYWADPEKARLRSKKREKTDKVKRYRKGHFLKYEYGLTLAQYETMLQQQDNCCLICSRLLKSGAGGCCVDHNHSTGKVRGLLCQNCNTGLGMFQDSCEILIQAINYLKKDVI